MTQEKIAKALAEQVQRDLAVERIRGWSFPEECDLAVKVMSHDKARCLIEVSAKFGDVEKTASIPDQEEDMRWDLAISDASEGLVKEWLRKYGVGGPRRKRRSK